MITATVVFLYLTVTRGFTPALTHPGLIRSKWNLPRPKKVSTGHFFALLRSAGLFDSRREQKKNRHLKVSVLFLVTRTGIDMKM